MPLKVTISNKGIVAEGDVLDVAKFASQYRSSSEPRVTFTTRRSDRRLWTHDDVEMLTSALSSQQITVLQEMASCEDRGMSTDEVAQRMGYKNTHGAAGFFRVFNMSWKKLGDRSLNYPLTRQLKTTDDHTVLIYRLAPEFRRALTSFRNRAHA